MVVESAVEWEKTNDSKIISRMGVESTVEWEWNKQ